MKATDKNAVIIMLRGGAVLASSWTTGSGNYISKRPIPAHCAELSAEDAQKLGGVVGSSVRKLIKAHPRAQKIIVVTDVRAVRKLAKAIQ